MSILINEKTKVIVQGIGKQGTFNTEIMKAYGTNIVGLISKTKEGEMFGIPIYKSVKEAAEIHKPDFSIIFIPAKGVREAALEALENELNLVIISEGVPVHDAIDILKLAKSKGLRVLGPNCPGLMSAEKSKLGIMPSHIFKKGNVGMVSRSGTLTYEIVFELSKAGIGQTTVVGIGGDPIVGTGFIDCLELFEKDPETESIVVIGEIGGNTEEKAAEYIKKNVSKKVVAYIAGRSAPKEKKMGHAGAIIEGNTGTAESKIAAFEEAGIQVAEKPSDIVKMLQ